MAKRLATRLGWAAASLASIAAAPAPNGGGDDQAIIAEINKMRADPAAFAAELRAFRTGFRGSVHYTPGNPVGWQTEEGIDAVDEAIDTLADQPPLPSLDAGATLAAAAADHAAAQQRDGSEGHDGLDGSDPGERVKRRGGDVYVAEIIAYGATSPRDALIQFLIDDGVPDRGHREVLLDPDYRFAGARCTTHPVWRQVCVVTLAVSPDGKA